MVQEREDFHHLRHSPADAPAVHERGDWRWGSEGTGASDLSRWLLADALRVDEVEDPALVEAFADCMIRSLPRDSWELCETEVRAWVYLYGASH